MQQTTKPANQSPTALWTIRDVAGYLNVSTRTAWRWTKSGKIPAEAIVRISAGCVKFRPDGIMQLGK